MSSKPFVSTTELAAALGVHPKTLRRMVRSGSLPKPLELSRNIWVWSRSELARALGVDL